MATTTPHPLVTAPLLYVADVPATVKWSHLSEVLKACGFVRSGGKSTTESGRNRWTIMFTDILHAEMALATLQGAEVPGILPTYRMTLSHASTLSSSVPEDRLFPQYFKGSAQAHGVLASVTAQEVFMWFRKAGPLVSVRVNVVVGAYPTCVIEYWEENHARYAWIHCRMMHPALSAFKPSFQLHSYDPYTLTCTGFGATWRQFNLHETFSEFGKLIDARMIKVGSPDAHGIITYSTPEGAEKALDALNGKMVAGKRLSVRFSEPEQQGTFRPAFASRSSQADADQSSWRQRTPSTSNPNSYDAPGSQKHTDVPPSPTQTQTNGASRDPRLEEADDAARLAKLAQEAAEREERVAQDALTSSTREYNDARGAQASADLAVEEAERVLLAAKERQLQAVHRVIQGLEKKNKAAERERDAGRRRRAAVLDAEEKKARAEEVRRDTPSSPTAGPWGSGSRGTSDDSAREKRGEPEWRANARRRQASTKENMSPLEETFGKRGHWGWGFQQDGTDWRDNAWHRRKEKSEERSSNGHQQTSTNVDSDGSDEQRKAGQDGEESRREDEFREEEEENMREEVGRRTRLEESIKKMKLMREQEELDRHERQRKVEQEELLKRKEAERTAREAREKQAQEEKERLAQEAQRRKTYDEAVGRETFRCQIRDRTLWNILPTPSPSSLWTDKLSISRFQGVSTEFDTIKFCDSQPVTSASIPWPVLQYPPLVKVEDIDWSAVEQFFAAAKRDLIATEYKAMVEKAHRRFHPDKWRSRGLLITVIDDELRKRLENAGNIVAQAITPLWLASKSR